MSTAVTEGEAHRKHATEASSELLCPRFSHAPLSALTPPNRSHSLECALASRCRHPLQRLFCIYCCWSTLYDASDQSAKFSKPNIQLFAHEGQRGQTVRCHVPFIVLMTKLTRHLRDTSTIACSDRFHLNLKPPQYVDTSSSAAPNPGV
jgi:hypothetical protein